MDRPPRSPHEPLFNRRTILLSLLQGVGVLAVVLTVFAISLFRGDGELHARALTFTTLIVANLALIWTNRSWTRTILQMVRSPNKAVWWVTAGAVIFLTLALCIPFLRNLFRFSALHPVDIVLCLGAGMIGVIWFDVLKLWRRNQGGSSKQII